MPVTGFRAKKPRIEGLSVAFDLSLSNHDKEEPRSPILHTCPPLLVMSMFSIIPAIGVGTGLFSMDIAALGPIFLAISVIVACGLRLSCLKMPMIGHFVWASGTFYLIALIVPLACAVLARTALPYADEALSQADQMLGFDWMAMIHLYQAHPIASEFLARVYMTLNWQPQLLLLLLCIFRSTPMVYRFLTAWALCLLVTVALFPFFPAVAAFDFYRINVADMPGPIMEYDWKLREIMDGLRNGMDTVLGLHHLKGIITMPSFHAASAVLLTWGYWSLTWMRWPFLLLNVIMIISALPIGGHYLIDIFAGMALAALSIQGANHIHRRIDNFEGVRLIARSSLQAA